VGSCSSGRVVAYSAQAVLRRVAVESGSGSGGNTEVVFGCLRGSRRPTVLADGNHYSGARRLRVAGRFAAAEIFSGYRCTFISVQVFDLRRRASSAAVNAGSGNRADPPALDANACDDPGRRTESLELRSDGAAAYTTRLEDGRVEVCLIPPGFRLRNSYEERQGVILAADPNIAPRSLRLTRTRVVWTAGTQERSAPAPAA